MVNKVMVALVIGLMSVGCVSAGGEKQNVSVDDILEFVGDKLAATATLVQTSQNTVLAALAEQNKKLEEARTTVEALESIIGPLDADKDGEVSSAEAEDFYKRAVLSNDPAAKDLATQGDVWTKLISLMAAAAAARKLGHKLPKNLQWLTMFFGTPPPRAPPAS